MTEEVSNSLYARLFSNRSPPYFNAENSLTPSISPASSISDQSQNSSNPYGTIIPEALPVRIRRSDNCFTSIAIPIATTDTVENIQIDNIHIVDERPPCTSLIPYFFLSCMCPSLLLIIIILSRYMILTYGTEMSP